MQLRELIEVIEDTTQVVGDETGLEFLSAIGTVGTTYMYICGPVSGKVVLSEPSPAIKVGRGNATRERWTDQPSILQTAGYHSTNLSTLQRPSA